MVPFKVPSWTFFWKPKMGKIRRGNFIFVWFIGDHSPPHVHVFRDNHLLARWNLEDWQPLSGNIDGRIDKILRELLDEGAFDEILKSKKS
jgi:hypothetical protein